MNYDIIIIGAGLSGIGAACHLERKNPDKNYKIFEARSNLGGTWNLFKYPGIRSDSDMYTFGYSFKTWDNPKSFADAPSILNYLKEAVMSKKTSYNDFEHFFSEWKGSQEQIDDVLVIGFKL